MNGGVLAEISTSWQSLLWQEIVVMVTRRRSSVDLQQKRLSADGVSIDKARNCLTIYRKAIACEAWKCINVRRYNCPAYNMAAVIERCKRPKGVWEFLIEEIKAVVI